MHTHILRRIAGLPVIREVLGAAAGGAIALVAYNVFEFGREMLGYGVLGAVATRMHGAASLIASQGTAGIGVSVSIMLAAGCAFLHCRLMSRID